MRCDCCFQESEVEVYDINGMIIEICSPCFRELQLEVISIEGLDKEYYKLVFAKLGIEPKKNCKMCHQRSLDAGYTIGDVWVCDECFEKLNATIL